MTSSGSYGTYSSSLVSTMQSSEIIETLNSAAGDIYYEYDANSVNGGYPILISINY